jgi:hypothetical protein
MKFLRSFNENIINDLLDKMNSGEKLTPYERKILSKGKDVKIENDVLNWLIGKYGNLKKVESTKTQFGRTIDIVDYIDVNDDVILSYYPNIKSDIDGAFTVYVKENIINNLHNYFNLSNDITDKVLKKWMKKSYDLDNIYISMFF